MKWFEVKHHGKTVNVDGKVGKGLSAVFDTRNEAVKWLDVMWGKNWAMLGFTIIDRRN